jgi:formate dehydrogenase maturation protein FdhE
VEREATPSGAAESAGERFPLDEYAAFQARLAEARDLVASGLELLPDPIPSSAQRVRERLGHGVPVVDLDPELPVAGNLAAAASLIVAAAEEAGAVDRAESRVIGNLLLDPGGAFVLELAGSVLRRDTGAVAALGARHGLATETLLLVGENLARPVLERQARGLTALLDDAADLPGTCPACGNPPRLSLLSGEGGRRKLACGMCRTEWPYQRIGCPFCGCVDQGRLRYFTVDGEPDRAVEVCDGCRRYLKQVRLAKEGDQVSPLDLDVGSARLDVLARREGYR